MEFKKIFIIGSGTMGTGISQSVLQSGINVSLYDVNASQLEKAKMNLSKQFARNVEKGRVTEKEKEELEANLTVTTTVNDAKDADMIIEAASENYEIKKTIFAELDGICAKDTIFATNTSSIPITKIASGVSKPSRFVGTHFFHPAAVMRLLEIVKGLETSDETIEAAKDLGRRLGKETIVSNDTVGFIVNRLVDPMANEAIRLLEQGVGSALDIDKGAKFGLNHPMGPFELMDNSGLDVLLAVLETMYADTGDPRYAPAPLLRRMVESGNLGRKTGKGFYNYT
jgi:3-hydroxybutyryl-CoA dehydrogenase